MSEEVFLIICIVINIICGLYSISDFRKRGISILWAIPIFFPLYGLIGFLIFLIQKYTYNKKLKRDSNHPQEISYNYQSQSNEAKFYKDSLNLVIPETCPHCKNPNNKKIRLCEWCGNQIC